MRTLGITFGAAALSLVAGAVLADPTVAKAPKLCDGVYGAVSALTDYRFDGFSESNRAPTGQATFYCYRNDGWFVGTTVTGVDFLDAPRTPFEADWYAGRQLTLSKTWKLNLELLYASFPAKRAPGPSYDLVEPQAELIHTKGRLMVGAIAGWEDNVAGDGQEWHAKTEASYQLAPWLSLSGHAGRFFAASGGDHDHDHWDVGATATWKRASLDLRYGGTDEPLDQCFYTDWCRPGAYATFTWRLAP
ncbi:MAG TPA: TorF family putative porin [Caulobacteraceae bacterium]|jgi:uncharacterized protein (TIGR02001 family)